MHPVPGATPLATALPLIEDILARSPPSYPRKQVTFLTDLQRAAWQGLLKSEEQDKTSDAWQRLTKRADVAIVDVARHDTDNLCVAEVRISDPAPLVNSAVSVTAVIVNFGLQECQDLPVQLLIARPGGDYTHPVASEQVVIKSLPPGGRTTVTFGQQTPIRFSEIGQHLVVVQVTNRDALAQDDRRGLVVPVRGTIPVALVEGRPEAQAQRRTAVDLQRALLPDPEAGEWTPARPRVLTVAEFSDPALGSLEDVDAVYLCDLPVPSPEWLARLEAFSRRGGTIIWGLGPNTAAHLQEYNRILHQGGKGLLPFPLEEVVGSAAVPDKAEESFRLAASEEAFRQPLLALFRDERVRGGLISVPFRRYIRVRPTPQSGVYRWMDFVPGQRDKGPAQSDPALLEWRWQRGRVFLFTSSFNEDWNDWPVLPTYLPFHQELLRYAAIPPDRHTLTVGDPLEEYYPLSSVGLTVRWQPPEGDGR
ncbi:MAG: hypothetical protein NZ703_13630, partial [Gemmataceae bacterium]|nr:hypothetical protein [Gemmataceae bacterium]